MSNLELWNKVEKTPHEQTKPITGKAYKGNSPKPHYIVWKATETFGPAGIGWGFEIIEEKLLDGALIEPGFYERIHMARVRVWYEWNGKRGTVEHVGQTMFCGKRSNGAKFSDEDAPKKSVTDGLIKALSLIGFAGDIFLGRYDDSKYVEELREEGRQRLDLVAEERKEARNGQSGKPNGQAEAERTRSERMADSLIAEIEKRDPARLSRLITHPAFMEDYEQLDDYDKARVDAAYEARKVAA